MTKKQGEENKKTTEEEEEILTAPVFKIEITRGNITKL